VAAHVCFETAGSVEALTAAVNFADEVPLPTSLAVRSPCAVVGEVHLLVCRIVRGPAQIWGRLRRDCVLLEDGTKS
jgi:hypothetical protein